MNLKPLRYTVDQYVGRAHAPKDLTYHTVKIVPADTVVVARHIPSKLEGILLKRLYNRKDSCLFKPFSGQQTNNMFATKLSECQPLGTVRFSFSQEVGFDTIFKRP